MFRMADLRRIAADGVRAAPANQMAHDWQGGGRMKGQWRFAVAAVLVGATALVLQARNSSEIIPPRPPLSSFPSVLGDWTSTDVALTQDVRNVLGPGDFLLRNYRQPGGERNVFLFLAYFPSQRAGDTIHSPKNCLPGAGWT